MSDKISWLSYEFGVYPHSANWSDAAGIYIFCGLSQQNRWVPLYIGQATSFHDRLPAHEQWNPARKHGATHVHAKVVPHQSQRDLIEKLLIQTFQPPLNTQLK